MSTGALVVKTGKMTQAQYASVHRWVRHHLGTPQHCEKCGTTEKRMYAWANISGEYKRDLKDWMRLCYPCHARLDKAGNYLKSRTVCIHGHPLSGDNVYVHPVIQRRYCRTCVHVSNAKWRAKRKLERLRHA